MALEAGTRIGPYEVLGSLGAGGMGEVCRARDTKLNRDVALKVLPDLFAADVDRMSRFQREAQLLAALNHPNIAAIYGLEDSGGRPTIVMELVEGTTLTCPLPIEDALRIAKQITEAIEYAHDRGIIHRDLKPANIKVTPDGTVKVLDFGLAKAMDDVTDTVASFAGSMSPTLSLGATQAGVIMGTAAYMAPEQAKGRPADRRSDVWAFGIVLYEMLSGEPMFAADSVPETLASVMRDPIAFGKLPDDTPSAVRRLIARCLDRDPRRRLQSIGEARIVIEDVLSGTGLEPGPAPTSSTSRSNRWPWVVAAAAVLALAATIGWVWSRPAPAAGAITRFTITPAAGTSLTSQGPNAPHVAVSPDGRYVAYVVDEKGRNRTLWVRAFDSLTAQRLDRTDGAVFPFWSPDSKDIAYFANGRLMRVSIAGGAPRTLCDAPTPEGGTWFQPPGQDGEIIFAPSNDGPLQRVLAVGGVPTPVTALAKGETSHASPQFLPDGQRFLYLARGSKPAIYVQRLGSQERTRVMDSTGRVLFTPPSFLLFLRDNTLLAQRLNLDSLRLEGEPVSIAEEVRSGGPNGRNAFSASTTGIIVYRGGAEGAFQISAFSRDGKRETVLVPAGEYGQMQLSSDGNRLVMVLGTGADRDLWIKDLESGVFSRLTSAPGPDRDATWSPDSRRIAYVGTDDKGDGFFETTIGSGKQTRMPLDTAGFTIKEWTSDGAQLLIRRAGTVALINVPKDGAATAASDKPRVLVEERYTIDQTRISPNGRWIAYSSTESGQSEINVAAFPSFTNRIQITSGGTGAVQPSWRGDGKELFYVTRERDFMAVDVTESGTALRTGPPRLLFQTAMVPNAAVHLYAVSRDGKRFYLRESVSTLGDSQEPLFVITNWPSLVR